MYLKSIKAVGFKSFADKIDIEINKGITAIVGPNGSGKSNIVDAVRWVLGEQSSKSLRGETSSDVIFSGSSSRDAHKRASVSLIFDNSDHYLNSEFTEVEVKRCAYIDGESEYYLNNIKVRLKDITNLFIDSGAGNNSFNIISQGNITDIVNSKPVDRRIIFESASGVLKYKKRKEETLRKLDKTKENMMRVHLIIDELKTTVEPLKKQSEDANLYLKCKKTLDDIEISLVANDILNYKKDKDDYGNEIELINQKLSGFKMLNNPSIIEKLKTDILKINDEINDKSNELIGINDELAKLNSEKQLMIERKKFDVNNDQINNDLLKAKEELLNKNKEYQIILNDFNSLKDELKEKINNYSKISDELLTIRIKKNNLEKELNDKEKEKQYLQNKIDIAKTNIENQERLPLAVKYILNNYSLKGIHDTIGNLITVEDKYEIAISSSLSSASNFIIVDTFNNAKDAINYLKSEKLGRATFFPLETIKSRYIDREEINKIKAESSFIGVASDLVKTDSKYKTIIENQLGNTIIVQNIDGLNKIGKLLNYRYRVVSLDGDILYSGGSVSGGINKINNTMLNKQDLTKMQNEMNNLNLLLKNINFQNEKYNVEYHNIETNNEEENKIIINLREQLNNKNIYLDKAFSELNEKEKEIANLDNMMNNKLDEELSNILELIKNKDEEKTLYESNINNLRNKRIDLSNNLDEYEKSLQKETFEYNKLQNKLKENEIESSKIDVKLDNLLINLNDNYHITYEYAINNYSLDIDVEMARKEVKKAKKEMELLGDVNLGAINEYERLSQRYNFLVKQEDDLKEASEELLLIINDMDDIMIDKFKTTFAKIAKEFKIVYKDIFQGGKGELMLTDPQNLLETGVSIIAEPPGKKINSTIQLSGGEKSLTAICLLFAILNVRPVPFIILDEAEAALDEANVEMFGKYISKKKESSQFILVTHKKKMMEYADTLYGITMQESGVSKIVSSKLE